MSLNALTKSYPCGVPVHGNFLAYNQLILLLVARSCDITVSLLRSRLSHLAFDAIPERFSSSLPPLFASGRFATFLSSAR